MTLGDLLASARRSAAMVGPALAAGDPGLARAAERASAAAGEPLHSYARVAVADFARHASENDWSSLLRTVRDSDDPGADCLAAMVAWRIARDATGAPSS